MARKTRTRKGRAVYRRKTIVEPVFGQMQTTQDAPPPAPNGASSAPPTTSVLKLHRNGGPALPSPG